MLAAMLPSTIREFEKTVRSAIDPIALPSVAYGIARGGETLLLGAAGLADKTGIPATPETSYALASVTKPMTATAVAILAEGGLVDLDAPIEEYLGGLRLEGKAGDPKGATVRRVAGHIAGLPLHYRFYYADEGGARRPFEEVVAQYGKLFTAPGERYQYSNLGYGLLDALISNVAGVPYSHFMAERIFGPLGMSGTSIGAPAGAAIGYGPDGVAYPAYGTDHPGGSAAFASVEDLIALGRFHLGGGPPLLRPEARRAMQVPTLGYGLGWAITERHGLRLVQHTGSMGGVNTVLRLVPSLDLVVAILANGEGGAPWRLSDDALASVDEGFRNGLEAERIRAPDEAAPSIWPRALQGVWSGTIETPEDNLPFSLEVGNGNGKALVRLDGRESSVDDLRLAEGRLRGTFDGDLGLGGRPYRIHLDLEGRDEALQGAAVAITQVLHPGGHPAGRQSDALSFWTELCAL